jgi:hypothetical protein
MSYDLFLKPRHGTFDPIQFLDYFRSRSHYEVSERQALYGNPDSGVYFGFELEPPPEDPDEEHLPISFNINFFRPSYFILEAELEVTAFVRYFDLVVFDPQIDGMEGDEYQSHLLIKGWNRGNEFAFASLLRKRKVARDVPTLPAATLMEFWRWNLGRAERQARVGDTKSIPRILFVRIAGEARSAAFWPDGGIRSIIPHVDYLVVDREKFDPEQQPGKEDQALVAWEVARPLLERYGSIEMDNSFVLNDDAQPPGGLAGLIQSLPAYTGEFVPLSADDVLDRELVEKYARKSILRRALDFMRWRRSGQSM